ncbi:GGDEF domain-containing protein [Gorillibacterium sp. CAU 1737]|uniref:GGDEF domain-containing protein n=1 Tax=Gorillibacterium sp. CAU 1737 TaxID=3140362 RepID=UPI003261CDE9
MTNTYLSVIMSASALVSLNYIVIKLNHKIESFRWVFIPLFTGISSLLMLLIPQSSPPVLTLSFAPLVMASLRCGFLPGFLSALLPALFGYFALGHTVEGVLLSFLFPVLISSLFHRMEHVDSTSSLRVGDGIAISGILLLGHLAEAVYRPAVLNDNWLAGSLLGFAVSSLVLTLLIIMHNDDAKNQLIQQRLELQANQDSLTRLPNLHSFLTIARNTIRLERVAIFMVDIDNFKLYNDTYGHQQGDTLLREIGAVLQHSIGPGDYAARYGGEEFIILCHRYDGEYLRETADRLCRSVEEHCFSLGEAPAVPNITISIGISVAPAAGADLKELIREADQALYHSKKMGKNRYTLHHTPNEPELHVREIGSRN